MNAGILRGMGDSKASLRFLVISGAVNVALDILFVAVLKMDVGGAAVAGRITGLANVAITALSSAATTFSGQNYGAKKMDRLKQGHIKIPLTSGMITLAFGLLFLTIHKPILRFFSQDEMVLMYASRYVTVMLLSQWCYAIFNGISCIVNGVGQMRYTTLINILMLWRNDRWQLSDQAIWAVDNYCKHLEDLKERYPALSGVTIDKEEVRRTF